MDDLISKLSEIRSEYNCFDENEEPYYRALSEVIKFLSRRADGDTVSREAVSEWLKQYGQDVLHGKYKFSLMYIWKNLMDLPSAQPEQRWIPVTERLPEEDNWLGCSWGQFSSDVLVSILNSDDEDAWIDISHTIDGEWALELPRYCEIIAWMPLPAPYREEGEAE